MTTMIRVATPSPTTTRPRDCPSVVDDAFFTGRSWRWTSGPCVAVEHRFEVRVESQRLIAVLAPVLAPLRSNSGAGSLGSYRIVSRQHPEVPYALYYGHRRLTLATRPEPLLRVLTWHINRQMIDRSSHRYVVLHAAAATRADVTVLLPGDQERGKTTTVAGLLREGFGYVTDEAVAVDSDTLDVVAFPKALSIDEGSWPLFPECRPGPGSAQEAQWHVPARWLGATSHVGTVTGPRIVVFPRFVAGTSTRRVGLSRAGAVRELAEATFHFPQAPARNLRTLAALVRHASVATLHIGSLDAAVTAIESMVSERLLEDMCT